MAQQQKVKEASAKDYLDLWRNYIDSFAESTSIDLSESQQAKAKRIAKSEADPEAWFKYYFPMFCTAEPADFHKKATRRLLKNKEWYEVRAWSRELAKSARSMMELIYIALVQCGKANPMVMLLVSNSSDNAMRLLLPFKATFEANKRIINDYGDQIGNVWKSDDFCLRNGSSFRALGWGQSPRGARKNATRPNTILIDDIDTDEDCRNEDTMRQKINWIEQALIPTRSISNPMRILANGNIIHNNCAINKMSEKADHVEVVNIRDAAGKSTWPQKNSEADIDRVLHLISYESAQKEYYNNPMDSTDVFKELKNGKVPPLSKCQCLIYCDPSTSNKDVSSGSYKCIALMAQLDHDIYIVRVRLSAMSNANFIAAIFDLHAYATKCGASNCPIWIENNSLQAPFFEQVLLPEIYKQANEAKVMLPIMPDSRDKKDKYTRIEGMLEPINRLGHLIFNTLEEQCPHMLTLKTQFKAFSRKQKRMDGPDAIEGGAYKLREKAAYQASAGITTFSRTNSKRM
jgi:hypothetical protein